MNLILLLSLLYLVPVVVSLNCATNAIKFEFHRIRTNQKSPQTIIAEKYLPSVEKCAEFTKQYGGPAFNYAAQKTHPIKSNTIITVPNSNCEVLECPEFNGNYTNMINDTRYEYYSLYNLNSNQSTDLLCVPGIGVFKLHGEHKNYTTAVKSCNENGGTLADILSSDRTNTLSKVLSGVQRHAWIGLREVEQKSNYITSHAKSINCYRYRAWYPGHPKSDTDLNCVVLTNIDSWKTMDCSAKLPYICEILTNNLLH